MVRYSIVALCALCLFGWQAATVAVNFDGNWTALYCTGDRLRTPPQLESENIYTFPETEGFDGQFYHYIAHEPLPGELAPYVEAGRLRYRRILLPATAWLLSFGQQRWVDAAYIGAGFLFLLLGMWWTGNIGSELGLRAGWALLFVAVPASLIFVDRLTVDHVLAALAAGFAWYAGRPPSWRLYVVLALAPLAREIGLLLIAAYCLSCVARKEYRTAAVFSTAALPGLAWIGWLASAIGSDSYPTTLVPFKGLLNYLFHPISYPSDVPLEAIVQTGDALALLGMLLAIVLAVWLFWSRRFEPVAVAAVLFAGLAVFVQRWDVWQTVYNYGRIFSPLLLLVAIGWLPHRRWLGALPLAMVAPRVLMQFGRQATGVAGALFGFDS